MIMRKDCSIRLIEEKDLETVLRWRNSERIRANMFTDHYISMDEHRNWFKKTRESSSEICYITEYRGHPFGVVNISDVDRRNNKCSWGFYRGTVKAPQGIGTVMGYLALEQILEVMEIRKLCGEAFVFNHASINFHYRFGFIQEGILTRHILKKEKFEDVIVMALFRDVWFSVKDKVYQTCFVGKDLYERNNH